MLCFNAFLRTTNAEKHVFLPFILTGHISCYSPLLLSLHSLNISPTRRCRRSWNQLPGVDQLGEKLRFVRRSREAPAAPQRCVELVPLFLHGGGNYPFRFPRFHNIRKIDCVEIFITYFTAEFSIAQGWWKLHRGTHKRREKLFDADSECGYFKDTLGYNMCDDLSFYKAVDSLEGGLSHLRAGDGPLEDDNGWNKGKHGIKISLWWKPGCRGWSHILITQDIINGYC